MHRLHFEQYGDPAKPTILLLHGLIGSTRYWHPLLPSLEQYNVVLVDLLGFGMSPKPKRAAYDFRLHINAIQATLDKHGVGKVRLVVGLSMGALLAQALVQYHPWRYEGALLLAPTLFPDGKSFNDYQKRADVITRLFAYGPASWFVCKLICRHPLTGKPFVRVLVSNLGMPRAVTDDTIKHTYESYRRTRISILENQAYLQPERLRRPVTILVGKNDTRLDHSYLAAFVARSPCIRMIEKASIKHHPSYSHPELTMQLINTLMAEPGATIVVSNKPVKENIHG